MTAFNAQVIFTNEAFEELYRSSPLPRIFQAKFDKEKLNGRGTDLPPSSNFQRPMVPSKNTTLGRKAQILQSLKNKPCMSTLGSQGEEGHGHLSESQYTTTGSFDSSLDQSDLSIVLTDDKSITTLPLQQDDASSRPASESVLCRTDKFNDESPILRRKINELVKRMSVESGSESSDIEELSNVKEGHQWQSATMEMCQQLSRPLSSHGNDHGDGGPDQTDNTVKSVNPTELTPPMEIACPHLGSSITNNKDLPPSQKSSQTVDVDSIQENASDDAEEAEIDMSDNKTNKIGERKPMPGPHASQKVNAKTVRKSYNEDVTSVDEKENADATTVLTIHGRDIAGLLDTPTGRGSSSKKCKSTSMSEVALSEWIIKPLTYCRGVQVEGRRKQDPDGQYWHSTLIVKRVNSRTVLSASGGIYLLVGKMEKLDALEAGFSMEVVRKFSTGFPVDWQNIIQQFYNRSKKGSKFKLPQDKQNLKSQCQKKTEDSLTPQLAIKRRVSKDPFATPASNGSLMQNTMDELPRTRSGRMVKPHLAGWAGQRVRVHNKTGNVEITPVESPILDMSFDSLITRQEHLSKIRQIRLSDCMSPSLVEKTVTSPPPPFDGNKTKKVTKACLPTGHNGKKRKSHSSKKSVVGISDESSETETTTAETTTAETTTGETTTGVTTSDETNTGNTTTGETTTGETTTDKTSTDKTYTDETSTAATSETTTDDSKAKKTSGQKSLNLVEGILNVLSDSKRDRLTRNNTARRETCYHMPKSYKHNAEMIADKTVAQLGHKCTGISLSRHRNKSPSKPLMSARNQNLEHIQSTNDQLPQITGSKKTKSSDEVDLIEIQSSDGESDTDQEKTPVNRSARLRKKKVASTKTQPCPVSSSTSHCELRCSRKKIQSATKKGQSRSKRSPSSSDKCSASGEESDNKITPVDSDRRPKLTSRKKTPCPVSSSTSHSTDSRRHSRNKVGNGWKKTGMTSKSADTLSDDDECASDIDSTPVNKSNYMVTRSSQGSIKQSAGRTRSGQKKITSSTKLMKTRSMCDTENSDVCGTGARKSNSRLCKVLALQNMKMQQLDAIVSSAKDDCSDVEDSSTSPTRTQKPARHGPTRNTRQNTGPPSSKSKQGAQAKPATRTTEKSKMWQKREIEALYKAIGSHAPDDPQFWQLVGNAVPSRSLEECQQYYYKDAPESSKKLQKKHKADQAKKKEGAKAGATLSGKVGTLKRKRELRDLMDQHNQGYEDDLFDSTPMKTNTVKVPTLDDDDMFGDKLPFETPSTSQKPLLRFHAEPVSQRKTPHFSVSSPDKSVNRNEVDRYINRLKKRRKITQVPHMASSKKKKPVPSLYQDDLFTMEQKSDSACSDEEDKDYYWSDEVDK